MHLILLGFLSRSEVFLLRSFLFHCADRVRPGQRLVFHHALVIASPVALRRLLWSVSLLLLSLVFGRFSLLRPDPWSRCRCTVSSLVRTPYIVVLVMRGPWGGIFTLCFTALLLSMGLANWFHVFVSFAIPAFSSCLSPPSMYTSCPIIDPPFVFYLVAWRGSCSSCSCWLVAGSRDLSILSLVLFSSMMSYRPILPHVRARMSFSVSTAASSEFPISSRDVHSSASCSCLFSDVSLLLPSLLASASLDALSVAA